MSDTKQTVLHEILSALKDRAHAALTSVHDAIGKFGNKAKDLYFGNTKVTRAINEERRAELDAQEDKPIVTNVVNQLNYTFDLITKEMDLILQRDRTNGIATADLIINGVTLVADVPATALLELEKKVKEWMKMIEALPTLSNDFIWVKDTTRGENYWRTETPRRSYRAEKQAYSLVLLAPTDKHPGSAVEKTREVNVATIEETQYSGMIQTVDKAGYFSRLQELLIAAQTARMRANLTPVVSGSWGDIIKAYVLGIAK